jgi:alpha-tubulin suppressor-like RCC1 family protein
MSSSSKLLIIDTRIQDYNVFITSKQEDVLYVTYDYFTDTYASLTERVLSELSGNGIESVALVSHAVTDTEFKLLNNETGATLSGVQEIDASLNTWNGFRGFWEGIGATTIDLLGCALYMDDNWRYVLDTLEHHMGVNFRASIDDTGALAVGANWVLESEVEYVNAKDVYFTEDIEGWTDILSSPLLTSTAFIDNSGYLYTWGSPYPNGRWKSTPVLIDYFSKQGKQVQLIESGSYNWKPYFAYLLTNGIGSTLTNTNGELWMAGFNDVGQLGIGTTGTVEVSVPVQVSISSETFPTTGWTHISCGDGHVAGIKNGAIWCWGFNSSRQVGDGTTTNRTRPTRPKDSSGNNLFTSGSTAISCGSDFTVAINNGAIWCWGNNTKNQLGYNVSTVQTFPIQPRNSSNATILNSGATSISCGFAHTLAIVNGGLYAWGNNVSAELGVGNTNTYAYPVQPSNTTTVLSSGVSKIKAGGGVSFVVHNNILYSVGENGEGALGRNTSSLIYFFYNCRDISNNIITNPLEIGNSGSITLIIDSSGGLMNTGYNNNGQAARSRNDPTLRAFEYCVDSYITMNQIRSGCTKIFNNGTYRNGLFYFERDNSIYGVGNDLNSMCTYFTTNPYYKIGLVDFFVKKNKRVHCVSLSYTASNVFCMAVIVSEGLNSKLTNQNGELWITAISNLGSSNYYRFFQPTDSNGNIILNSGCTALSLGNGHIGVISNGRVYMLGSNSYGQLGNRTTDIAYSFVEPTDSSGNIRFTSGCTSISCGEFHTSVICNGALWSWGRNNFGQLGNRANATIQNVPVQPRDTSNNITLTSGCTSVSCGGDHTTVIVNGGVQSAGNNNLGQLGIGSTDTSRNFFSTLRASNGTTPVLQSDISKVSCSKSNTYILSNGQVWTCGAGNYNALGLTGNSSNYNYPVLTSLFQSGVTSIEANGDTPTGSRGTYVHVVQNGNLYGFGYNTTDYLLDLSTTTSTSTRTQILMPTGINTTPLLLARTQPNVIILKNPLLLNSITVSNNIIFGQTTNDVSLNGTFVDSDTSANITGSLSFSSFTKPTSVGTSSYEWTFTPDNSGVYGITTGTVQISTIKTTPIGSSITVSSTDISFGQTLASSSISYTGIFINPYDSTTVAGSIAFTTPTTKPTSIGTASYGWTFTPTSITNYNTMTGTVMVNVAPKIPDISGTITSSSIFFGQTIESSMISGIMRNSLDGSRIDGSFNFVTPTTKPTTTTTHRWSFNPTDSVNYTTDASGSVSITLSKTTPCGSSITVSATDISFGQTLASSLISYTGNFINQYDLATIPGTIAFTSPSTRPSSVGTASYGWTFTPTNTTNYNTRTGTISVNVIKTTPDVSGSLTASTITYGQALSSANIVGSMRNQYNLSSVIGNFSYDLSSSVPSAGTTSYAWTFTPTSTSNYNNATGNINVTVSKKTPDISNSVTATDIYYGQTVGTSDLSGTFRNNLNSESVTGSLDFINPSATPGIGSTTVPWQFTPDISLNYRDVSGLVNITVLSSTVDISQAITASAITFGQAVSSSDLSGTFVNSDGIIIPGTLVFNTPNAKPSVGTHAISWTFTPTQSALYQPVTDTVNLVVNKKQPNISNITASSIVTGQQLAASQVNGRANNSFLNQDVSGTFQYSTPTVNPQTGLMTQTVIFTPFDTDNYEPVQTTVPVRVFSKPEFLAVRMYRASQNAILDVTPDADLLPEVASVYNQPLNMKVHDGDISSAVVIPKVGRTATKISNIPSKYKIAYEVLQPGTFSSPTGGKAPSYMIVYKVMDASGAVIEDDALLKEAGLNLNFELDIDSAQESTFSIYHVGSSLGTKRIDFDGKLRFNVTQNSYIQLFETKNVVLNLPLIFDLSSTSIISFGETIDDSAIPADYTLADTTGNLTAVGLRSALKYRDSSNNDLNPDDVMVDDPSAVVVAINKLVNETVLDFGSQGPSTYANSQYAFSPGTLSAHYLQYVSSVLFLHPQAQAPIKNDTAIMDALYNGNLGGQFVGPNGFGDPEMRRTIFEQLIAADPTRFQTSDTSGQYIPLPFVPGDSLVFRVRMSGKLFADGTSSIGGVSVSSSDLKRIFAKQISDGYIDGNTLELTPKAWKIRITVG